MAAHLKKALFIDSSTSWPFLTSDRVDCQNRKSSQGHPGLVLGRADSERGLDARDVGGRRELAGQEFLEALQIAADDLQYEIDLAIQHVAFPHLRQTFHMILEGAQVLFRLAL